VLHLLSRLKKKEVYVNVSFLTECRLKTWPYFFAASQAVDSDQRICCCLSGRTSLRTVSVMSHPELVCVAACPVNGHRLRTRIRVRNDL